MQQFPKDITRLFPSVQVKNANTTGIFIPASGSYKGGDILQSMHCLELVLNGNNEVHSGSFIQHLEKGSIQFRKRGNYKFFPSSDYSGILFFIDDDFILDFLKQHVVTYSKEVFTADIPPFVFKSTAFIHSQTQEAKEIIIKPERFSSCIIKLSILHTLLHILSREPSKTFVTYLKFLVSDRKVELSFFMEQNYTQPLDLKTLATQTGRSLSSFKKDFQETYGTSPIRWVMNKRLEQAQYLLQNSQKTVSEIAYQCGFENTSHFSRKYRDKYGISPTSSR